MKKQTNGTTASKKKRKTETKRIFRLHENEASSTLMKQIYPIWPIQLKIVQILRSFRFAMDEERA